jgi:flagellin
MQQVNVTYAADGTNTGISIGATSTTSVQAIVGNTSGANPNQEATAGYAALQFSGAGFSDAGKALVSVNLAGVTDTDTLVAAVNSAIQTAGNGSTAAATAFKNANIVASVHTDSSGGQELAFSSSTAAFQVQAGDQMANALMGNVTVVGGVGGVAQGTEIAGTAATNVAGANTTDGLLTQGQTVKLVVTGGGLAGPVTLQVNTAGASPVSTTGAITDLETQFAANAQLTAAGLTMAGSSTPGTALSFASAVGQSFNVQVTGDTSNLLGLGSFLTDASKNADYTTVTAGAAYSALAVTGNATTTGLTDGLQISLNGAAATALTPIDLTLGANASAASITSTATILGGFTSAAGVVDITTGVNDTADITVINNGAIAHQLLTFAPNTSESQAGITSATAGISQSAFTGYNQTAAGTSAGLADQFTIALDGGAVHTITLDYTAAPGTVGAANFLSHLQTAIDTGIGGTAGQVVASWALVGGAPTGELTLTTAATVNLEKTGAQSTMTLGVATNATSGTAASTTITSLTATTTSITAFQNNNKFNVTDAAGHMHTITIDDATNYTAAGLLTDIQGKLATAFSGSVTADWALDVNGAKTGALTLTSSAHGAGSTVTIGAVTDSTAGTATAASLTPGTFVAMTTSANNDKFVVSLNGTSYNVQITDHAYTTGDSALFLTNLQSALNTATTSRVTASWGAKGGDGTGILTLTDNTGTVGAGSTIAVSAFNYGTHAVSSESTVTNPSADLLGSDVTTANGSHSFNIAIDGGPSLTVTLANATYSTASALLAEINTGAAGISNVVGLAGKVSASFDVNHNLIFTTIGASNTGLTSSLTLSATTGDTGLAAIGFAATNSTQGTVVADGGLTKVGLSGATPAAGGTLTDTGYSAIGLALGLNTAGAAAAANAGLTSVGFSGMTTLVRGADDAPQTVQSIAAQIQGHFNGTALVTVSNDNMISIASVIKGANSSVTLNAAANNIYGTLNLSAATAVAGQNSSIADIADNLNAQFAANSTYQAAGLKALITDSAGALGGSADHITIQSSNNTQFRLNAVGAPALDTVAALSSSVTFASISAASAITVGATSNKFNVSVDGTTAALTMTNATYTTAALLLGAVNAAIAASTGVGGLSGKVTAGWDAATRKLTLTDATGTTGTGSSVTVSQFGANTGFSVLGFANGATNAGQSFSHTENTGFGVAGTSFTTGDLAAPSSTGTAMSASDAYGTSNSTAFTFAAMQYGSDKQALTFSATDSNGVLETQTIALQNNLATNRAGVSIDSAVAYINQMLQKSISNPALQKIVAVKEVVSGAEEINFVSSLSNFTVGVAATANGDGLNGGVATQKISATNGAGANMDVSTQAGAMAAVTAIATAIAKLGTAQAAVGKGENELGYAVNLAQSQITNFSAAESQIRDANVAQQAANLSKAQVLSQASIAAMAQANSAPQAVLALLRG